jgi:alpha-tubulin suppressor-like RCC1 family protein
MTEQEAALAEQYLENEKLAATGEWGAPMVYASNMQGLKQDKNEGALKQAAVIRDRLMQVYQHESHPPENFIAQMAYTSLNTFMLTTDGRVFSWGAMHYCLGR